MTSNSLAPAGELTRRLPGRVLTPADPQYAAAADTLTGPGSPEAVVRPADAVDVATAVRFATEAGLPLAVRSGGHSMAGLGSRDAGVLIDLALLDDVAITDEQRGLVRIGGGARWGQVARRLHHSGLGLPAGDTAEVGVGGLTLGGGIGWLARQYGLTIDHLTGAEVVTADGRMLRADAGHDPELFWALRGGGGNFGVVTAFEFAAQPVHTVVFGTITFAAGDPGYLISRWRDAMRTADRRLTTDLALLPPMFGQPATAMITCCFCRPDGVGAAAALAPLRAVGTVTSDDVAPHAYPEVLAPFQRPPGVRMAMRSAMLPELSDQAIAAIAAAYLTHPTPVTLRSMGGAVAEVPADATAFAHRDAEALLIWSPILPADAPARARTAALAPWPALAAYGTGSYVNFVSDPVVDCYPATTAARLAEVKRTYDPHNLFDRTIPIR